MTPDRSGGASAGAPRLRWTILEVLRFVAMAAFAYALVRTAFVAISESWNTALLFLPGVMVMGLMYGFLSATNLRSRALGDAFVPRRARFMRRWGLQEPRIAYAEITDARMTILNGRSTKLEIWTTGGQRHLFWLEPADPIDVPIAREIIDWIKENPPRGRTDSPGEAVMSWRPGGIAASESLIGHER